MADRPNGIGESDGDGDRHGNGNAITCPFCGSADVRVEARKGSSICRVLYQCARCDQPFERFG